MSQESSRESWQPRFYLACAVSATIITSVNYFATTGWWEGLTVGFGIASVLALVFLAIQYWSLRAAAEVEHV